MADIDSTPLIEPQDTNKDDENYRLGGKAPLATLFSLLSGPLLSQVTNSVFGIVNSLLVSKGIGNFGLEVLSSMFIFEMFVFSFGNLMTVSASSHISYLFGQKREKEAGQMIADLLRFALFLGAFYPALMLPISKTIVKWLSGSEEIAEGAFKYLCISTGGSFVTFTYLLMCGILQGEGRTWLFCGMSCLAMSLDVLVFLPLFLFKFKFGIWCAALSTVLAQSVPMIILFFMYTSGKLSVDFNYKMLVRRFSPETKKALSVGFASFIMNLSESFPQVALQKFILSVASHVGRLNTILTLFNINGRLYTFTVCVMYAFDSSFIPSASYAYGKRLYKRVRKLLLHAIWIMITWSTFCALLMVFIPDKIVMLFVSDHDVLEATKELFPINFCTLPVYVIHTILISYLQATKRTRMASLLSVLTTLVPLPIIAPCIYYTHPKSLKWIYTSYICSDISTFVISLPGSIPTIHKMRKVNDGEEFPPEGKCCCTGDEEENKITESQSIQSFATVENGNA